MAGKGALGIIAFIVLVTIMIVVIYIETGFNIFPKITTISTTAPQSSNHTGQTTIPATTTALYLCNDYQLIGTAFNTTYNAKCKFTSSNAGIWVAAGNSSSVKIKVVGQDNKTYINQTVTYSCITFFKNFTGPEQIYNITMKTGSGGGACGSSIFKFNTTTQPPKVNAYTFIYNGNFSSGDFTGWNVTGRGFGTAPLNRIQANATHCYLGAPWTNYNETYFASTYHCGLSASPGNLTSAPFIAAQPFLNFKIISPQNAQLYVEILSSNNTPLIIAHYNTLNLSIAYNTSIKNATQSRFSNATIPLTTVSGKIVRLRVVAGLTAQNTFISAGQFYLSRLPRQDPNVVENLTIYNGT